MIDITETSERVHAKAHELFMQYGLRSVSMDDIANNLGISKKTIYLYYADKDALVNDVVDTVITDNEATCDQGRKKAVNAIQEVFIAMDKVVEMFKTMNPSVLFDMQKYYPKAFQKFLKHKNDYLYNAIKENISRGIKEELYRPDVKLEILSRYRVEGILIPFNPEFILKTKSGIVEIENELSLHFLYGLSTLKGYKLIQKYQQERTK